MLSFARVFSRKSGWICRAMPPQQGFDRKASRSDEPALTRHRLIKAHRMPESTASGLSGRVCHHQRVPCDLPGVWASESGAGLGGLASIPAESFPRWVEDQNEWRVLITQSKGMRMVR